MTATLLRRPTAITKGLAITAGTVGFMVGIPWALIHFVGNPLPTVVPSFEDIRFAITHGQIDQWTIVKGVAVIAWLAWAHLAASFTVEIAAAVRGGTAAAVRGLGATQWIAARAVSQFSLVFTLMFQSTIGVVAAGATPPPVPTLAMATSTLPSTDAIAETSNSGIDVPKPTISAPINTIDTPRVRASLTADSTKRSDAPISRMRPTAT